MELGPSLTSLAEHAPGRSVILVGAEEGNCHILLLDFTLTTVEFHMDVKILIVDL